jgi:hypothetical protein
MFLIPVIKYLRKQLKEGKLDLGSVSEVQSIMAGKVWKGYPHHGNQEAERKPALTGFFIFPFSSIWTQNLWHIASHIHHGSCPLS